MATTTGFYKDNTGYTIDKDPEARLDYQLDWSDWLPSGDTITSSSWSVETVPAGETDGDILTVTSDSNTTTATNVTVTAGTEGSIYRLYNTINTAGGLIERRFFRVKIKARSIE